MHGSMLMQPILLDQKHTVLFQLSCVLVELHFTLHRVAPGFCAPPHKHPLAAAIRNLVLPGPRPNVAGVCVQLTLGGLN